MNNLPRVFALAGLLACGNRESALELDCPVPGPVIASGAPSAIAGVSPTDVLAMFDGRTVAGEMEDGGATEPASAAFNVVDGGVAHDVDAPSAETPGDGVACGQGPHMALEGVDLEVQITVGDEFVTVPVEALPFRVYGPGDAEIVEVGNSASASLPPGLAASAEDHLAGTPGCTADWSAPLHVSESETPDPLKTTEQGLRELAFPV